MNKTTKKQEERIYSISATREDFANIVGDARLAGRAEGRWDTKLEIIEKLKKLKYDDVNGTTRDKAIFNDGINRAIEAIK